MNLHHQFKLPKALRNEWKALKFDGFFFFFFSFFLSKIPWHFENELYKGSKALKRPLEF
jgi:hypothetical protein